MRFIGNFRLTKKTSTINARQLARRLYTQTCPHIHMCTFAPTYTHIHTRVCTYGDVTVYICLAFLLGSFLRACTAIGKRPQN